MNEITKTMVYAGAAVVVLVLTVASRPRMSVESGLPTVESLNQVEDPLAAKSLTVIKFDEDTSSLRRFEAAEVDGVWSIPSHQNYPADQERQLADAATCVMNLRVLDVVSQSAGDHETYGVIEPDIEKLKPGAVGVGTRVTMTDARGDNLVHMIIGKEVKDQPDQRYVREVGRDPIYVVKLDPSKLSTRFEDWIEEDLLGLKTYDIQELALKDYSVELAFDLAAGGLVMRPGRRYEYEMNFTYDDSNMESKWAVTQIQQKDAQENQVKEITLADDEELNTEKLNGLTAALADLKIINVNRKPEGLSRDLKAEKDFATNNDAVRDLIGHGFYPFAVGENQFEVRSSEGEVLCQMKDGVQYVLRFGNLVVANESQPGQANSEEAQPGNSPDDPGIGRYLFVMAKMNEAVIEKPALEELPELPPGEDKAPAAPDAEAPREGKAPAAPDAEVPREGKAPAAPDAEAPGEGKAPAAPDTEAPGEGKAPAAPDAEDAPQGCEGETPETEGEASGVDEALDETVDDELQQLIDQRKAIEKENQRKLDEYQENLQQGRDRAKELNDRFGDWYYVISDDIYKKIHLTLEDVVQKKTAEEAAEGPGDAQPPVEGDAAGDTPPPAASEPAVDTESPAEGESTGDAEPRSESDGAEDAAAEAPAEKAPESEPEEAAVDAEPEAEVEGP